MKSFLFPLLAAGILLSGPTLAVPSTSDTDPAAWMPLGGPDFTGWQGLSNIFAGNAMLPASGEAVFRYPQGPKGWYVVGFRDRHDGTRDWSSYYGLQLDVRVPPARPWRLQATLRTPPSTPRQTYLLQTKSSVSVHGAGDWQRVTLPWKAFDFDKSQSAFLRFVQEVRLSGTFTDGKPGSVQIKGVRLTRAPGIALDAPVRGQAAVPDGTVRYGVTVTNCTDTPQDVALAFDRQGWEAMAATVSPAQMTLKPGASKPCVVTVHVPVNVPPGGHETQRLVAASAGVPETPASLEFVTAREVDRPSVLLTAQGWADVRAKAAHYPWAGQQRDKIVRDADAWQVPAPILPPDNYSMVEKHSFTFHTPDFIQVQNAAFAWQLTHDRKYAEKIALFLRRLADPETGYPATLAGTDQGGPQEGECFQRTAIAYDAVLDAGVLTDGDKAAIAHTFRLYMETMEQNLTIGNIGNWSVSQGTAALFCALSLGDLSAAERYLYGTNGFTDYLGKGVMDDGWWWECSTGYNLWVASELTQSALAVRPWGIDLVSAEVPANYSPNTIIGDFGLNPPYGVSFQKWGPNHRNTRSLKQFWDAIPQVADYRGVAFGMNDGHEELVGGQRLELAYAVFRDPAYATYIKLSGQRDLLYGVPELPADTPKPYLNSAYAENIGYSLLRSQTPGRPPREQIQAVLKTGTQGGFHGHFDRASLDNLTRYGRSFWNPESIWWGYPNYMYKFYVQTSVNHNMVVVDQKMQEAVPSSQRLFYAGKAMQVAAVETDARWSDPPYGGMQYFPGDTFASQQKKNIQSAPLATDRKYGDLGPYSDRVLQRRLAVVADDYVVLADYLKGDQPHTFDNLFQMKGFGGLEAEGKTLLRHDAQFNPDPHSSAQFITDCDWYGASAPAVGHFNFQYGPDADNAGSQQYLNDPGALKVDVHSLRPQKQEIMVAMPPETHNSQQWVTYSVIGDSKTLAHGESGVWILGSVDVDVPVTGLNELTLSLTTVGGKKKALFWSHARLVTADGKEIPVDAAPNAENVDVPPKSGLDYYGGPIKIAGIADANALPAQPLDAGKPSLIHIPLTGKNAVRFKATLGGDFPFGDESQRRKVYAIRSQGTEAHFLTVMEPYETTPMVKSAVAIGPGSLRVELADGRVQEIRITGLDGDGAHIAVALTETKNGQVVRTETTESAK